MLVLSRKMGQSIDLPSEGVTIRVMEIRGNRVQIGIEAPQSVRIVREEVPAGRTVDDLSHRPEVAPRLLSER